MGFLIDLAVSLPFIYFFIYQKGNPLLMVKTVSFLPCLLCPHKRQSLLHPVHKYDTHHLLFSSDKHSWCEVLY